MEFRKIIDIGFVGAMGPPGGGRQVVTNRFLRYFNFVAFPELEDTSMKQIFTTILRVFVDANRRRQPSTEPKRRVGRV